MGVVYRARDRTSGDVVAVKVLHQDQRPDRFLREAAVLAELSHPAVVRYVAHGVTSKGQVYLAMEWLEATSLSSLIANRRLAFPECLTLLRRVCAGLAIAHQLGVVHRDLKPANILVPDGALAQAKLIDFGIARRRFDPRITERGLLIGTLAYMSPEQARGAAQIEPASDVFSLGSVVYKCLTGDTPFGGGDSTAVLAKVLLDEPSPLGELASDVPHAFDELVSRMLAKAPESRPRDAGAVLSACQELGAATPETRATAGITGREQRVVWVALLGGQPTNDTETVQITETELSVGPESQLSARVSSAGGRFDTLANGTRVGSFVGSGTPRDQALGAVRVAELMRELARYAHLAVWGVQVRAEAMELNIPAIHGVGESLIYFVDRYDEFSIYDIDFRAIPTVDPHPPAVAGLHWFGIVQYVGADRTDDWVAFYSQIMGFRPLPHEVRFGIMPRGLLLESPCRKFFLQLIEPEETARFAPMEEHLQRVGLGAPDVPAAIAALEKRGIEFLATERVHASERGALTKPLLGSVMFELVKSDPRP